MAQDWTYDADIVITITCVCKNIIRYEEQIANHEEANIPCPQCGATYTANNWYSEIGIEVSKTPQF